MDKKADIDHLMTRIIMAIFIVVFSFVIAFVGVLSLFTSMNDFDLGAGELAVYGLAIGLPAVLCLVVGIILLELFLRKP